MSFNRSNELELSFLECFRMEPVLWDINIKHNMNKFKNHDDFDHYSASF